MATWKHEQDRALDQLRDLLEDFGLRHRDVEERLGWTRGYLSQLLKGRIELRIRHLEVLLGALGVAPADYFQALFPPPGPAGGQRRRAPELEVAHDVMSVASFGIGGVRELAGRLSRCERALAELARSGALDRLLNDDAWPARRAASG